MTTPPETLATAEVPAPRLGAIRNLLTEAFRGDFSDDDWEHTVGGRHILVVDGGVPVAHAAVVARPLRVDGRDFVTGYVEGVAAAPRRQNEGLGSLVMAEAGRLIRAEFELGALSTDAHHFYERLGWQRWQGPTYVRRRGGVERTADEDDGIMVLRCGPSAGLALDGAITCDERSGDDW